MIRHIVLFKLKDFSSEVERNDALEKVLINFLSLKGEIPQIRYFNVERNITDRPGAFDVIIDSNFDSLEDLRSYQDHPAHQYAVSQNKQWCSHKAFVDYKL